MPRLLHTFLLASLAAVAIGSAAHSAPHARNSAGSNTKTVITNASNKHSLGTVNRFTTTNQVKNVTSTNIDISVRKFVSRPPLPSTVRGPGTGSATYVPVRQYARDYGVRFGRGVFYRGLNHRQWTARYYHPRWRVSFWYDPSTSGWYYWNRGRSCFLPVAVIDSYPPTVGQEGTPPDSEQVPEIAGSQAPDVPNPEGIE